MHFDLPYVALQLEVKERPTRDLFEQAACMADITR